MDATTEQLLARGAALGQGQGHATFKAPHTDGNAQQRSDVSWSRMRLRRALARK